jgi:uncharacterized protein YheU (UPF0270 family)
MPSKLEDQVDQDREDLQAFGDGLSDFERVRLGEELAKIIDNKRKKEGHGFPSVLPKEIITKKVLKQLFPDERRAVAFLWAIRDGDEALLKIEEDKNRITQDIRNSSQRKWREHPELIKKIFKLDKSTMENIQKDIKSILLYGVTDPQEYADLLGDGAANLIDDWITAEVTDFRMGNYIKSLDWAVTKSKEQLIQGTYLDLAKVSLEKWLISAALFGQANRSMTCRSLMSLFSGNNRNRPADMLKTMRCVARRVIQDEDEMMVNRYREGNWLDVTVSVGDQNRVLYFQAISSKNSVSSLNEIGIRSIGYLSLNQEVNVVFDDSVLNAEKIRRKIKKAFNEWARVHRGRTDIDELLPEFIYRYNKERRYLLGWKLINPLLRSLMLNVVNSNDQVPMADV